MYNCVSLCIRLSKQVKRSFMFFLVAIYVSRNVNLSWNTFCVFVLLVKCHFGEKIQFIPHLFSLPVRCKVLCLRDIMFRSYPSLAEELWVYQLQKKDASKIIYHKKQVCKYNLHQHGHIFNFKFANFVWTLQTTRW